jgi:pyruvate dehydrogenase (quinone)
MSPILHIASLIVHHRPEASGALDESLAREAATSDILRMIAKAPGDLQRVLDAIAERAAKLCDAGDAGVWRVDGDRRYRVAHVGAIRQKPVGDERRHLRRVGAAAPVGHSLRGKEIIQYDNPHDVGMSGLLGYGSCHEAIHSADLLILVGTDFPYDSFLPADVRTAQIDVDASHLGRRTRLDLPVHGDVGETLKMLNPLVKRKKERTFLRRMVDKHAGIMTKVVGAYTRNVEKHTPIHPEYAAVQLDETAADDAVFTVDTGMNNVWAARYLTPNGKRRVIGSFIHGSMANALPHAIGAAFADRDRQVVALAGDGGLSMLLGELITVRTYDLPVKVVVFNNATLGMVKLEMLVEGLPSHGTDSPPVDYRNIATAVGIPAVRVEKPKDLRKALAGAFDREGPALVEIVTDPNALSIPPSITSGQIRGFATAMTKEIFGGGMGEVMAMARSNLRNLPR